MDATTFADLEKVSETPVRPWADATTPDGVFGTTVRVLGVITTYYLAGTVGQADAPIIGRVELHPGRPQQSHYIGTGAKGGSWVGPDSFPAHLKAIADA